MNIEVEIKIKLKSHKKIREKLKKIGKLKKTIRQIDEYYIPCQRDFFAKKPKPIEWLRIRTNYNKKGIKTIFEYDKHFDKKDGSQGYAKEYETEVSDVKSLRKILTFLDFKKIIIIDKKREYWYAGKFEIALDTVKNLGKFIEIEAYKDFKNTEEARVGCNEFAQKLGLSEDYIKNNHTATGYPVILMEKIKK